MSQNKNSIEENLIQAFKDEDYVTAGAIMNKKDWNPHFCDNSNDNLLSIAISPYVPATIIEKLCTSGTNVNHQRSSTAKFITPLEGAVAAKRLDIIKILVQFGANLKISHKHENRLLTLAVNINDLNIIKYFVEECELNLQGLQNLPSPFDTSLLNGNLVLIHYFEKLDPEHKTSILLYDNSPQYYRFILEMAKTNKPSAIKTKGMDHNALFLFAVKKGHLQIAQEIHPLCTLKNGSDIWEHAIRSKSEDIVKWMLSKPEFKKSINIFFKVGIYANYSPLGFAAHMSQNTIIRVLVQHGAIIDLMNEKGENAALISYQSRTADQNSCHSAELLFELGSNPCLYPPYPSKFREVPLYIFLHEGFKWVSAYLGKSSIIKILSSFIEAEYFRRTQDPLRSKRPDLLLKLIHATANYATPLLFEKFKTKQNETNKKMLEDLLTQDKVLANMLLSIMADNEIFDAILARIPELLKNSLIHGIETRLIMSISTTLQPYIRNQLVLGRRDKSAKSLTITTLEKLFFSITSFPSINSYLEEFHCLYDATLLSSKVVGEFECQLDPNFTQYTLTQPKPLVTDIETKQATEQQILSLDSHLETASIVSAHSTKDTATHKQNTNAPLKLWQKFKMEKVALLKSLHEKRDLLIKEKLEPKKENNIKHTPASLVNQDSSVVKFSIASQKQLLSTVSPKQDAESTHMLPNSQNKEISTISSDPKPLAEKFQNVATLFSMLEQGKNESEIITLANQIATEISPLALQRATLLFMERIILSPIDPKPSMLEVLRSQTKVSTHTALPLGRKEGKEDDKTKSLH